MNSRDKYKSSEKKQISSKSDPKEIVYELLGGLKTNLSECIKNIEKNKLDDAKAAAKKSQNIAFALRSCLDHKNGGDVSRNLDLLYGHIQFATDKLIKKNKTDCLSSAYFVSSEIYDGWTGLVNKSA